jgi:hypothetical protein
MMKSIIVCDVPPQRPGVTTEMGIDPVPEISDLLMAASNSVSLTKVVGRLEPFHRTVEFGKKFFPNTLRLKASPPADALVGEMLSNSGTFPLCPRITTGRAIRAKNQMAIRLRCDISTPNVNRISSRARRLSLRPVARTPKCPRLEENKSGVIWESTGSRARFGAAHKLAQPYIKGKLPDSLPWLTC